MNDNQTPPGADPIDLRDVLVFQKRSEIGVGVDMELAPIGESNL
jgi:hypothetical protein